MPSQQWRTLMILWAAMLSSTVMLLFVLVVIRAQSKTMPEPIPFMLPVLGIIAVAVAVLSVLLPKRVFVQALRAKRFKLVERSTDERMFDDSGRRPRRFANPEETKRAALPVYQTAMILGLALAESVALFGLVLGQLGSPLPGVLPFFVVSWGLMLSKLPTERAIVQALEQVYDADLAGEDVKPGRAPGSN